MMKKIAIDAGHGIHTPGKRCDASIDPGQTREWLLNSKIADLVCEKLRPYRVEVIRTDDPTGQTDLPLRERRRRAEDFGADLLISLHHNAGIRGGVGGGTVTLWDPTKTADSMEYAKALYKYVVNKTGLIGNRSKKVYAKSLGVCRTKCPAVMLENGFMDSRTDTPIILSEEHARKTAEGIIDFLVDVCKIQKETNQALSEVPCCYIGRITADDGLNMRKMPSSGAISAILKVIPQNEYALMLREKSDGWCYCRTMDQKEGWVYKGYIYPMHEGDFRRREVTDPTGLNIRSGQGTAHSLLATMPFSADFMVLSDGAWGSVWCGESIGYASLSDKYSRFIK